MGVENTAMSTLPANPMKLDMTGVIWSPMACRAFLKILIPQATKYNRELSSDIWMRSLYDRRTVASCDQMDQKGAAV